QIVAVDSEHAIDCRVAGECRPRARPRDPGDVAARIPRLERGQTTRGTQNVARRAELYDEDPLLDRIVHSALAAPHPCLLVRLAGLTRPGLTAIGVRHPSAAKERVARVGTVAFRATIREAASRATVKKTSR